MKMGSMPFGLVFISALVPMASSLMGVSGYHWPVLLTFAAFFITLTADPDNSRITFYGSLNWALALMASLLIIQVLTGRGFVLLGAGGYVLISALIFYNFLLNGRASAVKIIRGITFLYKIYIFGLIVEFCLIIFGQQPFLADFFPQGYKRNNPADVLRMVGVFQDVGGLNSILLGSQTAGMLSLFAAIWFSFVRRLKTAHGATSYPSLWFSLSLAMLLVTLNITVLSMVVMAVTINWLYFKKMRWPSLLLFSAILLAGLYIAISQGYLFERVFSDERTLSSKNLQALAPYGLVAELEGVTVAEYYAFVFLNPVYLWLSEGWVNQLLGVGAQFFLNTQVFIGGDFGFAADVLLKAGLLCAASFLIAVLTICLPTLKLTMADSNEQQQWSALSAINALVTLLWLFSTIHYNQAMQNPGGFMLFSLHLSLVMYCRRRLNFSSCACMKKI